HIHLHQIHVITLVPPSGRAGNDLSIRRPCGPVQGKSISISPRCDRVLSSPIHVGNYQRIFTISPVGSHEREPVTAWRKADRAIDSIFYSCRGAAREGHSIEYAHLALVLLAGEI